MSELQDVTTAPEQKFKVNLALHVAGKTGIRSSEGRERNGRYYGAQPNAKTQCSTAVKGGQWGAAGIQGSRYLAANAGDKQRESDVEHRVLEYRYVVVHQRLGGTEKRRCANNGCAGSSAPKGNPVPQRGIVACPKAPHDGSNREQPDQHGQVDMHDQGNAEKVIHGNPFLDERRSGNDQQDGEQPRGNQGKQAASAHHARIIAEDPARATTACGTRPGPRAR